MIERRAFVRALGWGLLLPWPLRDARSEEPIAPLPAVAPSTVLERIAFGSCSDQRLPQPHWDAIAAAHPQLLLLLGDNVYGDVTSAELTELREAYARLGAEPGFQRLRARVPILAIWDDHDYGLNDAGGEFPYRQASAALFRDFWGVPADSPRGRRDGLYDALTIGPAGRRVQVIVLDTRSFRSPLKATDERGGAGKERYLPDADPQKTMLGAAQWAWLAERLREPAELRLLVSSIQVLAEGHGWECWRNLPAERQRLLRLIDETGAGGIIILSGDRHVGAVYRRSDGVPYPLTEITSSSLNRPFRSSREFDPLQLSTLITDANLGMIRINWPAGLVHLELLGDDGRLLQSHALSLAGLRAVSAPLPPP